MSQAFPDLEAAAKTAAKVGLPIVSGRVFYSVPAGNPTLPLLTVARVSGGPQEGEAPLDDGRLTFSCWGKTKGDASDVARALVGWLRSLNSVQLDPETFCHAVTGINTVWLPDDEAKLARYVVDATFTVSRRAGAVVGNVVVDENGIPYFSTGG